MKPGTVDNASLAVLRRNEKLILSNFCLHTLTIKKSKGEGRKAMAMAMKYSVVKDRNLLLLLVYF